MIDKKIVCDVFDAYYYTPEGRLICMSKNLTKADITGDSDEQEVRNGRGNGLWSILNSNKSVEIKLTTNVFDFETLAYMAGTEVGTGKGTMFTNSYEYEVINGMLPIHKIPLREDVSKLNIFCGEELLDTSDFVIKNKGQANMYISLETDKYNGKQLSVMPYEFEPDSEERKEIKQINIEIDKFPKSCYLLLKGIEKNQDNSIVNELTIKIKKAIPSANFSFATSSEVSPSDTEVTLKAQAVNGKLAEIIESPLDLTEFDPEAFEEDKTPVTPVHPLTITKVEGTGNEGKVNIAWSATGATTSQEIEYSQGRSGWVKLGTTTSETQPYLETALDEDDITTRVVNLTQGKRYNFRLLVDGVVYSDENYIDM